MHEMLHFDFVFVPILASDSGKSYFASIFEVHCLLSRKCEICARIRNVWRSNFREDLERSWTYCTAWQQQSRWCPPRSLFSPKMSAVLEIIRHPEKKGTLQIYEKQRILGDVLPTRWLLSPKNIHCSWTNCTMHTLRRKILSLKRTLHRAVIED